MDREKLDKWAELLLDTGKRNNLVSFKNTKGSTADLLVPEIAELFRLAEKHDALEVYDPKLEGDDDIEDGLETGEHISRDEFVATYGKKLKGNQVLLYNFSGKPIAALRNIGKRARSAIEETGVNIAYIAMGFIEWREGESGKLDLCAPLLLMPITVVHESTVDPYRIIASDDDCVVNPTFGYKLFNEHGIKLPEFDDNVDEFLADVQTAVDRLGWHVTRDCKIGIFSFQKINMYRDLKDNADIILNNRSVQAVLGDAEMGVFDRPDPSAVDFNVVDADSSQLNAIALAESGASFVLQGPPGTGKSQTITNIISELLSNGKKVLFVSEKLAALNVVYDKLKKAGLDEFCLELHSHKANKKQIIGELCRTLKARKSALSDRAAREVEIKRLTESKLDGYVDELHVVRPVIGKSLYSVYEEYASYRKEPSAAFAIPNIADKSEEYLRTAAELLSRFAAYTESIGDDYRDNVWYGFDAPAPAYEEEIKLAADLDGALKLITGLAELSDELKERTGVETDSLELFSAAVALFDLSSRSEFLSPAIYSSDATDVRRKAEIMYDLSRVINEYKDKLDAAYGSEIYGFDGEAAYYSLTHECNGVFKRMFGKAYKRLVKKELRSCARDGKTPSYKKALATFDALRVYQTKRSEFDRLASEIKPLLGTGYRDVDTDFAVLVFELKVLERAAKSGVRLTALSSLGSAEYVVARSALGEVARKYKALAESYEGCERAVENRFDADIFDFRKEKLACAALKLEGCIHSIDRLGNWCAFWSVVKEGERAGLKPYMDYAVSERYGKHTVGAYKKLFYRQWIDEILRCAPRLVALDRLSHDEAVKLFGQKDELDFEINKARLKALLSAKRPSLDMVAKGSAVAVLLREGEKKRKQKGVRQLLSEIKELALTLKPCFLMSPLSVSTYLDSDMEFDAVVFDEASQIFPQDALGAIYRAKQLIVVGDSKQMPPSNFFNAVPETDEDGEEDVGDFESILDICSTCLPQCRLKWHYRSRYESLIAFSNRNFYDGDLVTFPSAYGDKPNVGVDYCFVEHGVFDRKTKTNLEEAKRVVELVFENFEKFPDRSVGVVAFSVAQQELIDRLIVRRRRSEPDKEKFFRSDLAEPFFVKNLETVQGDERDTVIFSVAYAMGSDGKFLHNFGPLNRSGGERRLNVAVTRAKCNVKLVTCLHAENIDLSRAGSEGAKLLRDYLDYAERGANAFEREPTDGASELFDEFEFEREVCEFLRSKGFRVDMRVGCSAYKIDMAVKMPQSDDCVLAIECDGSGYRAADNTRDRDRLRTEVLERMGWKFYRVWSVDWYNNNRIEKDRLFAAACAAVDGARGRYGVIDDGETPRDRIDVSFTETVPQKKFKLPLYTVVDEHAAAARAKYNYLRTVKFILDKEAPLAEEWLLKRTVFMFGREKVTDAVKRDYRAQMWSCASQGIIRRNGFLYIKDKEIPMLRVPSGETLRDIKHICIEELANGILAVLEQNVTADRLGLYRLLCERLGASRLSDAVTERFDAALMTLTDKIDIDGENISIKK